MEKTYSSANGSSALARVGLKGGDIGLYDLSPECAGSGVLVGVLLASPLASPLAVRSVAYTST